MDWDVFCLGLTWRNMWTAPYLETLERNCLTLNGQLRAMEGVMAWLDTLSKRWFDKFAEINPKKWPRLPDWVWGRGVQLLIGQRPNKRRVNLNDASLRDDLFHHFVYFFIKFRTRAMPWQWPVLPDELWMLLKTKPARTPISKLLATKSRTCSD